MSAPTDDVRPYVLNVRFVPTTAFMTVPKRADLLTLAAFAAIVIFLGANFVAVRFSNRELPPFWGAAIRFAIAAGLLLAIVAGARIPLPRGPALRAALLFGLLAFFATYALAYWGLVSARAAMGAVAFATVPLITLFLAAGVGLERIRIRGLAGAGVALGGTALAFFEQVRLDVPPAAVAALLLAALFAAAAGIVVKRAPKAHPVGVNAIAIPVGAGLLFATSVAVGEPHPWPTLPETWAALAWLVVSTILAFVLFVWVLGRWSASASSYSSVLTPFVTLILAALLVGEVVTFAFVVGSLLVLAGVYLGVLSGKERGSKVPKGAAAGVPGKEEADDTGAR